MILLTKQTIKMLSWFNWIKPLVDLVRILCLLDYPKKQIKQMTWEGYWMMLHWLNKWKGVMLNAVVLIIVAGCVNNGKEITNSYCLIAKPIYISSEDRLSDFTIEQLLNHNEKWEAICQNN